MSNLSLLSQTFICFSCFVLFDFIKTSEELLKKLGLVNNSHFLYAALISEISAFDLEQRISISVPSSVPKP
jgi:hypothetical protein